MIWVGGHLLKKNRQMKIQRKNTETDNTDRKHRQETQTENTKRKKHREIFFLSVAKATNLGVMGHANCMGHNSF